MKLQSIIYIICNLLSILGLHVFLSKLYPSSSKKTFRAIGLIFYYILDCSVYIFNDNPYFFFISSIILFAFCTFFYINRNVLHIIIMALVLQIFVVCSELLVAFFLSIQSGNNEHTTNVFILLTIVLSKILFFSFLLFASYIIKNRIEHLPAQYIFGAMSMPTLSAIIILYIFSLNPFDQYNIKDSGSLEAILVVFAIVTLNVISCLTIKNQCEFFRLKSEQEKLQGIVRMQQEYYEHDLNYRKEIGRLRHDFKNFLVGIKADILTDNKTNAIKSIDSQISHHSLSQLPQCNIFAIDAILLHKYNEAKDYNIDVDVTYLIANTPLIDSCDLSVLIGNAMDNSIEYLSTHQNCDQKIIVKIVCDKGLLDISIENQIDTKIVIKENNEIDSTKNSQHGYGIKSASLIAEKYQGNLFLSCPDNKFVFNAILYC